MPGLPALSTQHSALGMITVHFPSMLHARVGQTLVIEEPIASIAALVDALDRRVPGLARELADPVYNFAVNDEMLLHGVLQRALADGDVVEIIPTIAGG